MKTGKRVLSLALVILLCLSLLPVGALAEGEAAEEISVSEEAAETIEIPETESPAEEVEAPVEAAENTAEEAETPAAEPVTEENVASAAENAVSADTSTPIADGASVVDSGTCGDNLTWTLTDDGVLTISGTGDMWDYQQTGWFSCNTPWTRERVVSVVIMQGVSSIGGWAFSFCSQLTDIEIPESVTSIGDSAFNGCSSLTSIDIPEMVTSIGDAAFANCSSLTSINIPDGVTSIESWVFSGCSSLTSINIPDGVTSIGRNAFESCSSLPNIDIPESVTSMGESAFAGCSELTHIDIPEKVTDIGACVLLGCSSLSSITIPNSVTSIGVYAFYECSELTNIYYAGSEEEWAAIGIESGNECLTNATIHYNWEQEEADYYTVKTYTTQYEKDGTYLEISYQWGFSLFEGDATAYNRSLAIVSAMISGEAYNESSIINRYEELGLSNITTVQYPDSDYTKPSLSMASQTYDVDGTEKTLVVMAIRGTQQYVDAITDLYDGGLGGFVTTGKYAFDELIRYCLQQDINLYSENTILYISGHSLGGAVAGRLAIELKNNSMTAKTFVYTYASARYDTGGYSTDAFPYVHNIVTIGDPVPMAPPYNVRVGNNYYYSAVDNGIVFICFANHLINVYLSKILKEDPIKTVNVWAINGTFVLVTVKCPVEIKVYDEEGNLVGYTEGETAYNDESLSVIIVTDGENKYVYMPTDSNYKVEIIGTGEGTMEYSAQEYDGDGQLVDSKSFTDVVITEGKLFESKISTDESIEETQLYVVNDNGAVIAEVMEDGQENVVDTLLGDVNGDNSVDLKDVTKLFQYVNKQIDGSGMEMTAADINGDGIVDLKDVTRLFQYVNKQIDTL